jgi:hypothetical protein
LRARAWGSAELVVKTGSFEIEVERDHAFAKSGQEPDGGSKEEGSADTTFIRIEGNRFHCA